MPASVGLDYPTAFPGAVFGAGRGTRLIPVADAVDRPQAVELLAVVAEGVADLRDILVQRPAPEVRMDAPDGVDQAVPADDDAGIGVQVVQDAELLAPELAGLGPGEDELEPVGMHFGAVEMEDARAEGGVDGEPAVARRLAAAEDGPQARHQFFGVVRFDDEIVGARVERLRGYRAVALAGKEDDRGRVALAADLLQDGERVEVRQVGIQEHEVHVGFADELEGGGSFMEYLGGKPSGHQLVGDRGGEAAVFFNDDHQRLLLGAHAEFWGAGVRLGGAESSKNLREVAKPL